MAKKKKAVWEIPGIDCVFDSKEEWMFTHWLLEAESMGLIYPDWNFHPEPHRLSEGQFTHWTERKQLKTKVKEVIKRKSLCVKCDYEPDFKFRIKQRLPEIFPRLFLLPDREGYVTVDTKGAVAGRNNNSAISFPVKQKWLLQKTGIYAQKVVPKEFFLKTWLPDRCRFTYATARPAKHFHEEMGGEFKTVSQIMEKYNESFMCI